ncbi:MAG: dephospho-CoA kinase [Candidatus Eremiobacteraeota bacterium]|nr:dephospho-CoA kinase [Candidatus Eremiobacteraeota bacterium]MBV9057207.1 dephospho-CoA kinase [Candidatus Eremiobacteraeota bacterium]MBV9699119.1 dephospho-CoA kinase [Candidatus Eremiobacteraeota bacterium]
MRVGLTGGIGAGKSEVAAVFRELGAFIVDTDEIAREVVAPGGDALMEIGRKWPQVVRGGLLDRAALAEIIFTDASARSALNALLHPHIRRRALEREAEAKPHQIVVHVVPLLFETGYDRFVDKSILVAAPLRERVDRIVKRDRLDRARVEARIAAQIPQDEAVRRADVVIENDGDLSSLEEQARRVFAALTAGNS